MKICVLGESDRLNVLSENLTVFGHCVEQIRSYDDLRDKIDADCVVLPVPTFKRSGELNLKGVYPELTVEEIISKCKRDATIISCGYKGNNNQIIDLNERDDFAYLNAIPTAEGAILYALQNSNTSLFYSHSLITGFGRVAKVLADRLCGLKGKVTICARSSKDLSYAKALGYQTVTFNSVRERIKDYDLIFQTVPSKVIDEQLIDNMNKNTKIIELSSKSSGTDFLYANEKSIEVIHAPALPEKIAPLTAGNILTDCILSILKEADKI